MGEILGGRTAARHRIYDATKMYGARAAFANSGQFLRRAAPIILAAAITPISIDFGNISGPLVLGAPAQVRSFGSFNPSLVAAPAATAPTARPAIKVFVYLCIPQYLPIKK